MGSAPIAQRHLVSKDAAGDLRIGKAVNSHCPADLGGVGGAGRAGNQGLGGLLGAGISLENAGDLC